jgi:hypothetical protein
VLLENVTGYPLAYSGNAKKDGMRAYVGWARARRSPGSALLPLHCLRAYSESLIRPCGLFADSRKGSWAWHRGISAKPSIEAHLARRARHVKPRDPGCGRNGSLIWKARALAKNEDNAFALLALSAIKKTSRPTKATASGFSPRKGACQAKATVAGSSPWDRPGFPWRERATCRCCPRARAGLGTPFPEGGSQPQWLSR